MYDKHFTDLETVEIVGFAGFVGEPLMEFLRFRRPVLALVELPDQLAEPL
jgi:hypothetical protein